MITRASPGRRIDPRLRREFAEKLIRGLHYAETGEILGVLDVRASMGVNFDLAPELREPEMRDVWKFVLALSPDDRLAPGLSYRRYHFEGMSSWAFWIWEQVVIMAFARPPGTWPGGAKSE